jgi:hypothetical protein
MDENEFFRIDYFAAGTLSANDCDNLSRTAILVVPLSFKSDIGLRSTARMNS